MWYPSDFLDALHPQCFSAVLYIYLATITNAITFGGLLGEATDGAQVGRDVEGGQHKLGCSSSHALGSSLGLWWVRRPLEAWVPVSLRTPGS